VELDLLGGFLNASPILFAFCSYRHFLDLPLHLFEEVIHYLADLLHAASSIAIYFLTSTPVVYPKLLVLASFAHIKHEWSLIQRL
jgi:hypothetical protein